MNEVKTNKLPTIASLSGIPSSELYFCSYMHRSTVQYVVTAEKYDFIITMSNNGAVVFWHRIGKEIKLVRKLHTNEGPILSQSLSPDSEYFATLHKNGKIILFDVGNYDLISHLDIPEPYPNTICFSKDTLGIIYLNYANPQTCSIYRFQVPTTFVTQNLESIYHFPVLHRCPILCFAFSNFLNILMSIDEVGNIQFWGNDGQRATTFFKSKKKTDLLFLQNHELKPVSATFSPLSDLFAICCSDFSVRIFNYSSGQFLHSLLLNEIDETALEMQKQLETRFREEKSFFSVAFTNNSILAVPTPIGLSFYSPKDFMLMRIIGRVERTERFTTVALLQNEEPMAFCTAFDKQRFYVFTNYPPLSSKRDVMNEIIETDKVSNITHRKTSIAQSLFSNSIILHSSTKQEGLLFSFESIKIFPFPLLTWELISFLGFLNHLSDEFSLRYRPKQREFNHFSFSIYFRNQPAFSIQLFINDSLAFLVEINKSILNELSHVILISENISDKTLRNKTRAYQKHGKFETLEITITSPFIITNDPIGCLSCLIFNKFQTPVFTSLYKYLIPHCSNAEKEFFAGIYCFNHLFKSPKETHFNTFNAIKKKFGGTWYLDYLIENDTTFNLPIFSYKQQSGFIKSLVFIPNESHSIINFERISCIQLDGTFHFFHPYVLSIPVAIINNAYIPLGFSIGPSENFKLFSNFYNLFIDSISSKISSIPVLSDGGTAIHALCTAFKIPHYFCITHLLRLIGGNNRFIFLFKKLLNITSEEDVLQFLEYLNILILEINDRGELETYLEKIGLQINKDTKLIENGVLFRQCCFAFRIQFGIPKTTNNLESLHSHINDLKGRHNNFWCLVCSLIDLFQERYSNFLEGVRHNYHVALSTILKSKNKLTHNTIERETILYRTTQLICNCDQYRKYSALFGVEVPCRYQLALGVVSQDISLLFNYEFAIPNTIKSLKFNISQGIKFVAKSKKTNVPILTDSEIHLDIFPTNLKNINPKNIIFEAICHTVRMNTPKINLADFYSITWDSYYNGPYKNLITDISTNPILSEAVTHYLIFKIQSFLLNRNQSSTINSEIITDNLSEVANDPFQLNSTTIHQLTNDKI
jgi:hypothetical protein